MRTTLPEPVGGQALNLFDIAHHNAAQVHLHIGRHKPIPVDSAEAASRIWQMYRDALNLGGSESPNALLKVGGMTVGHVSYNGRVWKGQEARSIYAAAAPLVSEAAPRATAIDAGDWIPVESMETGALRLVKVLRTFPDDGGAFNFDWSAGERIYYHPERGHDRFFVPTSSILA